MTVDTYLDIIRPLSQPPIKPLEWVASAKKDLLAMPDRVIDVVGYALHLLRRV